MPQIKMLAFKGTHIFIHKVSVALFGLPNSAEHRRRPARNQKAVCVHVLSAHSDTVLEIEIILFKTKSYTKVHSKNFSTDGTYLLERIIKTKTS